MIGRGLRGQRPVTLPAAGKTIPGIVCFRIRVKPRARQSSLISLILSLCRNVKRGLSIHERRCGESWRGRSQAGDGLLEIAGRTQNKRGHEFNVETRRRQWQNDAATGGACAGCPVTVTEIQPSVTQHCQTGTQLVQTVAST